MEGHLYGMVLRITNLARASECVSNRNPWLSSHSHIYEIETTEKFYLEQKFQDYLKMKLPYCSL